MTLRSLESLVLPVEKRDPKTTGRSTIRYIDIGSLDGGGISATAPIDSSTAPTRARQIVREGDVLFSTVRPYLRKIARVPKELDGEFASTGFCVLRPSTEIDSRYLFHYLTSEHALNQVLPLQRGVSYPAVSDRDILGLTLNLPSMDEQLRVVDVVEGYFSRLDAADMALTRAARRVDGVVASLLTGETGGDYRCMPLSELAIRASYGTSEKCTVDGPGPVVVRIPNVVDGGIDLTDSKHVLNPNADVSAKLVHEGDVLIIRTNGSQDLIGRAATVGPGVTAAFASYLIRYQVRTELVLPEWVVAVLSSPRTRVEIQRAAASSAGQYNLSLAKLGPLQIPVPPLDEQKTRLARIASVQDQTRRLTVTAKTAALRSTSLRRAVLTGALTGNLSGRASESDRIEELAHATQNPR